MLRISVAMLLGVCAKDNQWIVMTMKKKRVTMKDGVKELGDNQKKQVEMEKAWKKEGWCYQRKSETIWKPSEEFVCNNYPVHEVSSSDTKYDILRKNLPHDFLLGTLRRRAEDREGGLTFDKGNG
eukprot:6943415-Ditylum_brightwellii.AAC.1